MLFSIKGAVSFLAALATFSTVLGAPVGDFESRDVASLGESLGEIVSRDAMPLTHEDVIDIQERAALPKGAPTPADFTAFFKTQGVTSNVVFWSGFKDPASTVEKWAASNHRKTLEMVMGTKWAPFQKVKSSGGAWDTWADAVANFWDPASRAFAQQATGEVWFVSTGPTDGKRCWDRMEKPALMAGKKAGKVKEVVAYDWNNGSPKINPSAKLRRDTESADMWH